MAQYLSSHKPVKLNLDKARKYLSEDEAFYLLNHDVYSNTAEGKGAPTPANFLACDMQLPAGENYNVGRHYDHLNNCTYGWTYNNNGVNFIWRIKGNDGECQIVYAGNSYCLPLSPNPKHTIENWRAYVKIDKLCANRHGIALIWVDGTDTPIGMIDVEASIATNFFTTPFFQRCENECAPLQLCVPEPNQCLHGDFIPFSDNDKGHSNKMLDKGFKFMYRHVYYDQRASEYSDRSSLYYQDAKGCFDSNEGFSRCMKFRLPIGGPMVDTIDFAFSEDGGLTWFQAETIEKYKKYNSSQQYWYERELLETVSSTFSDADCSFDYIFCNDKQRLPIDPLIVSRELNPIPREVQGLVPIKESLGFYNYKKGSCPIDKIEDEKFDIKLDCSNLATECDIEYVKVKVRAIVHNQFVNRNSAIARNKGNIDGVDDVTDTAYFITPFIRLISPSYILVDQKFSEKTRNFIVYIEGTDYWGQMEQYRSTPHFTSTKKVGVLSGMISSDNLTINTDFTNKYGNDISNGNFYFQEYTFVVKKGTKGFLRLTSHHQVNGVGENQNTSTYVVGILDSLQNYTGTSFISRTVSKEIYFDTCNGDVDLLQAFIIAEYVNFSNDSSEYSGYITDKNNQPVEGASISSSFDAVTTDHNGFYSLSQGYGVNGTVALGVNVEQGAAGVFSLIESFNTTSAKNVMSVLNYQITSIGYQNNYYNKLNIPVKDCNNNPVVGVRVALSGLKYRVTDNEGIAYFKVRNYSGGRTVIGVIIDKGNCFTTDCFGNCNPCIPSTPITALPLSFNGNPSLTILFPANINVRNLINKQGLKKNGRYAFGWVVEGDCGKLSAVNPITSNGGYINIPSLQQSKVLSYCSFTFTGGNIKLPLWANRLKIVRSKNLNSYNIQWIIDKIDRTNNSKIVLTIQTLNDYNTQYNFHTNTIYKYQEGDRIEFLRNGDGKIFDVATNGVLSYLALSPFNDIVLSGITNDANFFNQLVIIDDNKLDGLKEGAVIEIQTPSASSVTNAYFEICASIPVINGELTVQNGTFTTFDTFLVSRKIGKFPAQYFESKTPSDFWGGTNLDDTGKVHFINKYENERRYGRNITINSATQFNYFGDFEKTFNAKEQGDIIALSLKDDKVGLGISENDNFLFQVSDQLLRVGSNNVIQATTADSFISNPEAKLRGKYGCSYEDIGSILFGDGFVMYNNSQNDAYIIHNYSIAKPAGEKLNNKGITESSCNSFFKKRNRQKSLFNKTSTNLLDNFRFSTGQNKHTGVVYLTIKSLRHSGINNAKEVYELPNDTIMYNPANDNFLGFSSATPEGYSQLDLHNDTGCAFITFQNSLPYIHEIIPTKYNEFFSVAADWMVGICLNKGQDKIKIPIAMEIQADKMFFASKVTTDKPTFLSEIPPVRFKGLNGKWNAAFLNDLNSKGDLYNGANARGYFVDVLLIRDNTISLQYNTIDNNKRILYSELDNILIKFEVVEQSGFTENL